MGTFEMSLSIDRPPQVIFDFISQPANDPLWVENALSSEWTSPGPADPGVTKRVEARVLGLQMESHMVYGIWEPPNRYGAGCQND